MKKIFLFATLLATSTTFAQDLPRKSARSIVKQQVGLNNIELNYSRPNVNSRVIFGDLVPFGKVWRLGANEPTTISLEHPIFIGEQKLDAGKYAVFAIPEKSFWTVVFNTDTEQWGASNYDPEKNVLSYTTAISTGEFNESFEISFTSVNETSAVLTMEWANTDARIPFTTNTSEVVEKNITEAIEKGEELARVYYRAADYYNDEGKTQKANEFLNKSLKIEQSYYNLFLKATMEKSNNLEEAKKIAEEAAKSAEKAEKQDWADYIRNKSSNW